MAYLLDSGHGCNRTTTCGGGASNLQCSKYLGDR